MPKKPKVKVTTPVEREPEPRIDPSRPLGPDQFVPLADGYLYFGLKSTQIDQHIQLKNIPAPITIADSTKKGEASRRRGWFGSQILDWKQRRLNAQRPIRVPRLSQGG
jgi:hypothetical protein